MSLRQVKVEGKGMAHPLKVLTADKMMPARIAFSMTSAAMKAHVRNIVVDTAPLGLCCAGDLGGDGDKPRADRSCAGEPRRGILASPLWNWSLIQVA